MRTQGIVSTAAFAAFLALTPFARASSGIAGSVAFSGFAATSGTVTLFGYDPITFEQESVDTPMVLGAPGAGTYSGSVAGDKLYSVHASLADATGGTLVIWGPSGVPVSSGSNAQLDIALPTDYGFASLSGSVLIDGQVVSGGTVSLSFYLTDPNTFTTLVNGTSIAAIDVSGHYAATIGPGNFTAQSLQTLPACIVQAEVFGYGSAQPGESVVLDLNGTAPPHNPPPGRLVAKVGVTGLPQAAFEIDGVLQPNTGRYTPDCEGGYAVAGLYPPVPAGTYPLVAGPGQSSDRLTPGPWLLDQANWSLAYPDLDGRADYRFAAPTVEVPSGADAHLDLRRNAAFVRGKLTIDSSRWAPASSNPFYRPNIDPGVVAPGGDTLGFTSLTELRSAPHLVLAYELPIDPAQSWTMSLGGWIPFLDDSQLYLSAQPPNAGALPKLKPGKSTQVNFPTLFTFGTGSFTAVVHVPITNLVASLHMTKTVKGEGTLNLDAGHTIYQNGDVPALVPVTLPAGSWRGTVGEYSIGDPIAVEIAAGETVVKDLGAPDVTKVSPQPGTVCKKVKVRGVVSDADGVGSLKVNGTKVDVKKKGGPFSVTVEVPVGDSAITIVATDQLGNAESRQRPVHRNGHGPDDCSN